MPKKKKNWKTKKSLNGKTTSTVVGNGVKKEPLLNPSLKNQLKLTQALSK